jgi:hypothetical protein
MLIVTEHLTGFSKLAIQAKHERLLACIVLSVVTPQYNSSKYANDFCGFDRTSHA